MRSSLFVLSHSQAKKKWGGQEKANNKSKVMCFGQHPVYNIAVCFSYTDLSLVGLNIYYLVHIIGIWPFLTTDSSISSNFKIACPNHQ